MRILGLITGHRHYWGIPHVGETDERLIQICYECGAHRQVEADLQPSAIPKPPRTITTSTRSSVGDRKAA